MQVKFKPHTVVLLVGPTRCGKTTFSVDVIAELSSVYKCVHLSSDGLREQLLQDYDVDSHSRSMLEVSRQAFQLLMAELKAYTEFPISTDLVIVDTRGFDKTFREEVTKIARGNGYFVDCVCFDYRNASDYLEHVGPNHIKVVSEDVQRFRRKCLPELSRREFDQFIKVKESNFKLTLQVEPDYSCTVKNGTYLSVEKGEGITIISDTHECVEQLDAMLKLIPSHVARVVHVGDYLDKGNNTVAMINYMHSRVIEHDDIVVIGNHEAYVYRRLKEQIKPALPEVEDTYFTSLKPLLESEELRTKFFYIYENSVPFLKVTEDSTSDYSEPSNFRTVYVTHAPCDTKYLGKFSDQAQRAQRNLFTKNREGDVREEMKFIFDQASPIEPLQVFGHLAHQGPIVYKNKVFLDTGCVHGGQLTAMVILDGNYSFIHVPGVNTMPKELSKELSFPKKDSKPFSIHDYELSPDDQKFLRRTIANGVKFISGTMAPAPSANGQLEPLSAAFDFYRNRGVDRVVLQPKYMGSRCQFYLDFEDSEKSFAVSRNGHVIRHVEGLKELVTQWSTLEHPSLVLLPKTTKSVILDGELLPWSALGSSLIDKEFLGYQALIEDELKVLTSDPVFQAFELGVKHDSCGRVAELEVFKQTLSLYGGDAPLEFKPFNILEINGHPNAENSGRAFGLLSTTDQCVVDLVNPGNPIGLSDLLLAEDYFKMLTFDQGMEGVVVKPVNINMIDMINVPEYMKVRNEKYLTLVYGYDYKRRYDRMVQQKNISGKVRVSIAESNLGRKMLASTIEERPEFIVKMIAELNREKTLDPRL